MHSNTSYNPRTWDAEEKKDNNGLEDNIDSTQWITCKFGLENKILPFKKSLFANFFGNKFHSQHAKKSSYTGYQTC